MMQEQPIRYHEMVNTVCDENALRFNPECVPRSKNCIFPFIFDNRTFHTCTDYLDEQGQHWCSTKVEANGVHAGKQGEWGYCVPIQPGQGHTPWTIFFWIVISILVTMIVIMLGYLLYMSIQKQRFRNSSTVPWNHGDSPIPVFKETPPRFSPSTFLSSKMDASIYEPVAEKIGTPLPAFHQQAATPVELFQGTANDPSHLSEKL